MTATRDAEALAAPLPELRPQERRAMPRTLARPSPDARHWLFLSDLTTAVAVTMLVSSFHRFVGIGLASNSPANIAHVTLFLVFDALLVLRLGMRGQYEVRQQSTRLDDLMTATSATFVAAAVAVFLALLTKGYLLGFTDYSRRYTLLILSITFAALCAGRITLHAQQRRRCDEGSFPTKALVIGDGTRSEQFLHYLGLHPRLGKLGMRSQLALANTSETQFGVEIGRELDEVRPHEVLMAFDEPQRMLQEALVRECAVRGVSVRALPGVFHSYKRSNFAYDGLRLMTVFETAEDRFARSVKRVIDVVAALLGLVALTPVFLIIGVLIKLEDHGPVIYRQERIGLYGSSFRFWKFRTMALGADRKLEEYLEENPAARAEWDQFQKLHDDPRVTRIGRFLRSSSIDELPQLINVVFGEMSLVGPRPPMADQANDYGTRFVFSQTRPGITGLWQVSGRSEIDFQGRIDLDVSYVENWSIWLDAKIMVKTVLVVLRGSGAC